MKSISFLIAAALIAVTSHSAQAQQKGLEDFPSVVILGHVSESVEIAVLLKEVRSQRLCSLSLQIDAFGADAIDLAPLQTEHVELGPNGFTSVEFPFSIIAGCEDTCAMVLSLTEADLEGGCEVLTHFRISGPGGETRAGIPKELSFLKAQLSGDEFD